MLIASWSNFIGCTRRVSPRRLPDGMGVDAVNLRLGSGSLEPWKAPSTVVTTGGATPLISLYRMNRSVISDTAEWLQWTMDVDVVQSLVPNDPNEEIYYTGDGAPKLTDATLALPAIPGPAAWRMLGVPKPTLQMAPPATLVAGSGTTEARVYIDTFKNSRGRESAPGIPRTFSCPAGTTATLSGLAPVPGGSHDITLRRIYCSTDGGPYQLVVEQTATATTATDSLARGAVMQSGGDASKPAWEEPPPGTVGLINLWNSMIGGITAPKSFGVCEPGKPWAWPVEYQDTVNFDIVATGRWLQNWLLLTTGTPYLVTGSSPLSLSNQPIPFNQACVSKRSVQSLSSGIVWASQDGLCFWGQGGPRLLTEALMTPEQWQALVPGTIIGARVERYYVGFFNDGEAKGFIIDPLAPEAGIVFLSFGARGAYYDPISTRLYLQEAGNTIKRWGAGSPLTAKFKTGITRVKSLTNPGAAMVVADEPVAVTVTLWANVLQTGNTFAWTQVFTRTVTSGEPFTLPGGYVAHDFQAQLESTGPVSGLVVADDVSDFA